MSKMCNRSDAPTVQWPATIGLIEQTDTTIVYEERWRPRCERCANHFVKRSEATWAVAFAHVADKDRVEALCRPHLRRLATPGHEVKHVIAPG